MTVSPASMSTATLYAGARSPLQDLYESGGVVRDRAHRVGCAVEVLGELLWASLKAYPDDPVLWALLGELSKEELTDEPTHVPTAAGG